MADLRVPNIDDNLVARLKAAAALARPKMTMQKLIVGLLEDALKRYEGRRK